MNVKDYEKLLEKILKKYNRKKPDIPARMVEDSIENITSIYAESYKKLFTELYQKISEDFGVLATASYQSELALMQMIEKRLTELNIDVSKQVQSELEKQYISGKAFHSLATTSIERLEDLMGAVPYTRVNTYMLDQVVKDTMEDLLFVTQHTSKELKKFIRDTASKNIHYHALKDESQKHIKQIIEKQLSNKFLKESLEKKGFVGIVDAKGRKWNTKNYVDMLVSTKLNQAYTEGLKDRAIETGKDLAIIPEKGAKDYCKFFEGLLISLTGATKGYMTYDQLKTTGLIFHPRCVHSPFPVGSIELVPEEDLKFHNQKVKKLKENIQKVKKSKKS